MNSPAQPAAARIYDYLLGGTDNYAVDRAAAERVLAVAPDQRRLARANRAFAIRAVRVLAEAGIRQFIDLGTGFPTSPSVHEAARQADPSARVVYVDHDPVVHAHNTALLATDDRSASVQADIRRPEDILGHPDVARLIDLGEPVVLLCARSCTWCRTPMNRRRSWRGTATAWARAATWCSPSSPATVTPAPWPNCAQWRPAPRWRPTSGPGTGSCGSSTGSSSWRPA
jgi:S-adenosyl methyltransferase